MSALSDPGAMQLALIQLNNDAFHLSQALRAVGQLAQADGTISSSGRGRHLETLEVDQLQSLMGILADWIDARTPEL